MTRIDELVGIVKESEGFDEVLEVFSDKASACMIQPFEDNDLNGAALVVVKALQVLPVATINRLLSSRSEG